MFKLTIRLGNEEMQNVEQVAASLRTVADKMERGVTGSRIMDTNGNVVGEWDFDFTEGA